jgi:hypothetical protein
VLGARARAVWRGDRDQVHHLSSTPDGSLLIITDPAVGVVKIPFDGPCRLVPRSPNLPAGYDAVEYESVGVSGSTMVSVHPGEAPSSYSVTGVCFGCCMGGPHDFSLWSVCPGEQRADAAAGHGVVYPVYVDGEPSFDAGPLGSEPVVEPASEPVAIAAPELGPELASAPEDDDIDEFLELDGDESVKKPEAEVVRNARLLAQRVWSGGGQPRHVLEPRGAIPSEFDALLNEGIAQRWIRIQSELIVPGVRSPFPRGESGGWGPEGVYRTGAGG